MTWHSYQVTYQLCAPLHIGYRRLGYVQCTRYYVPGRSFWGAITARLTRASFPCPTPTDYAKMGEYVRQHIIASYFYLKQDGAEPYYPRWENGRWAYGDLKVEDFEARFIGSYGSTALTASRGTAEEGTLHEIEFIAPKVQTDQPPAHAVCLQGYLYLDQDHRSSAPLRDLDDVALLRALGELLVGGEQGYGFGHIVQEEDSVADPHDDDGVWPHPRDCDGRTLRAHLEVPQAGAVLAQGPLEPVVGREWAGGQRGGQRRGAGQDISEPVIAWAPGSRIMGDAAQLCVGPYGIWRCL